MSSQCKMYLIPSRLRMRKMLIFSALACMVRPTNAVIWVYLIGYLLWTVRFHRRVAVAILSEALAVGYVVIPLFLTRSSPDLKNVRARISIYSGHPLLQETNIHTPQFSSCKPFSCFSFLWFQSLALLPHSSSAHPLHNCTALCSSRHLVRRA